MTTISVPLPADLEEGLNALVERRSSTKADVMRVALKKYLEDEAVEAVLRASKEPRLQGNLRELADQL